VTRNLNLPGSATEDQFHVSVAELLDVCLRPPDAFYTTFPAGYGRLSKSMAGRLRAKGMKAGMPDILVFYRRSHETSQVIGLELKVRGNSTSAAQRGTHALLQAVGVRTYLVRSINDVIRSLHDAGIPYRNIQLQQVA
jgi:VRR-NUC domain.